MHDIVLLGTILITMTVRRYGIWRTIATPQSQRMKGNCSSLHARLSWSMSVMGIYIIVRLWLLGFYALFRRLKASCIVPERSEGSTECLRSSK